MINLVPAVLGSNWIHPVHLCINYLDFRSALFHELRNLKPPFCYMSVSLVFCTPTEIYLLYHIPHSFLHHLVLSTPSYVSVSL